MERIGRSGLEWQAFLANLAAHAIVAFAGYALFGGARLFRRGREDSSVVAHSADAWSSAHWFTIATMASLAAGVIFAGVNIGLAAFAGAVILGLTRSADPGEAIARAPWDVLLMISGVTVLIALIEKTGGMTLFVDLLARISTRESVTAVVAFVTGLVSTYSSTSGVVMPAFLPAVPGLAERLGADPAPIALSISVGAHLVDVSPLSTIGALSIASAAPQEDVRALFNKLLAWGFSMTVAGALLCFLFFRAGA
jgi:di/tricarboxylate transporter